MADEQYVRGGLGRLRAETERFIRDLIELDEVDWAKPTVCPPWDVKALAAHLVRGAESYSAAIEQGLRGSLERTMTAEDRARRMRELASEPTGRIRELLRERSERLERLIAELPADRLGTLAAHGYGPRSITWFVQQRLAEVVFHHWDLRASLGKGRELDEDTARWLLPMLVESNLPMIHRGAAGDPAVRLAVDGAADLQWVVRGTADGVAVSRTAESAGTAVSGDAAALTLLLYGRATLTELEAAGRVRSSGDRSQIERFLAGLHGP